MFNKEMLISGKEDAANNFARGHYTVGREIVPHVEEQLKLLVEQCESFQVSNHVNNNMRVDKMASAGKLAILCIFSLLDEIFYKLIFFKIKELSC